jgi:hypothetical protein
VSTTPSEWRPGGRLRLGGEERTVATVLRGWEEVNNRRTEWVWAFLDDGGLLEVAERGWRLYTSHRVLLPGSEAYLQLAAPDGALARFERRVRAGRDAAEPTIVTLAGREYRVVATGNANVARDGPPPALGAWSALGDDAGENVYFVLADLETGDESLGLWTRAVCLSFGRTLGLEEAAAPEP